MERSEIRDGSSTRQSRGNAAPGFAALNPSYSNRGVQPPTRLQVSIMKRGIALLLWAAGAAPALAHGGGDVAAGFAGGFGHPLFGPDHVAAMVAVGLWGAVLGSPAIWVLPVAFPLVMAFGGGLGIAAVPIPHVEVGIGVSATLLGFLVSVAVRRPLAGAIPGG